MVRISVIRRVRTHLVAQPFYCQNCFHRMPPRHEVFRLQFFAGAGRETHAKVRQAFIPRAGHAHLLGAVFRGKLRNRVQVAGGKFRPVKFGARVEIPALLRCGS